MQNRNKTTVKISALMLAATVGFSSAAALAQSSDSQAAQSSQSAQVQTGTGATGKAPIQQSNEGFWGHMNPFARKKWVKRQTQPINDRLEELDGLNANNAKDIKDYDQRSQDGIRRAQSAADAANQTATRAGSTANGAQQTASLASEQNKLNSDRVNGLDQYHAVSDATVRFGASHALLTRKAKTSIDQLAAQLDGKQGYIIEVEGYSPIAGASGLRASQTMASAVARYLVTEHHVPIYRIHQVGLGNAKKADTDEAVHGSRVHVMVMENSLAASASATSSGSSTGGATQY